MLCCVNGCERDAQYKKDRLCQKHYFRKWRYGTVELQKSAAPRHENPQGYQWILAPDHPLRHKNGKYVAEHRAVLFSKIGPGPMCCAICGKGLTWDTCKVDHIDENVRNNEISNLRPTCNFCNTRRGMSRPVEWSRTHSIEFDGMRMTAAEWARDPRVKVCGRQIILRKKSGMSDEDALFAPKKTHKAKQLKESQQ